MSPSIVIDVVVAIAPATGIAVCVTATAIPVAIVTAVKIAIAIPTATHHPSPPTRPTLNEKHVRSPGRARLHAYVMLRVRVALADSVWHDIGARSPDEDSRAFLITRGAHIATQDCEVKRRLFCRLRR